MFHRLPEPSRATLGLFGTLLSSALCGCGGHSDPPANEHGIRHVLLVSIDTLRADRLGAYGFEIRGQSTSPRLDALAAEGVVFEHHYSAAPTTLASHTSLMTGTYPHTHGIQRNGFFVNDENEMLAELLRDAGFYTAAFVGAAPLVPAVNFDQGFLQFDFHWRDRSGGPGAYERPAEDVTDAVVSWLDERYGDQVDEPVFLFVHYFDVHSPYEAPAPFGGMFQERPVENLPDVQRARKLLRVEGMPDGQGDASFNEEFLEKLSRQRARELALAKAMDAEYCAEIAYTDHHLGRLFDELEARGIWQDALVLVTADHGETMYEHPQTFSHGETVYDTEIHTPLIVRLPGGKAGGRRVQHLASNVDVVPSILELLGLRPAGRAEGESFVGALAGTLPDRAPVFAEATKPWNDARFHDDSTWPNRLKYQCARTARFKFVRRGPDDQRGMFDLKRDPLEQSDLLLSGASDADVLAELERSLREWDAGATPLEARMVDTEDQIDALKALGYIGDDDE